MKRLILAALFALAVGIGVSAPQPVCADGLCGRNARCVSSFACGNLCTCIDGFCTSFQPTP